GDETAFGFRDAEFLMNVAAGWDDPEATEANVDWARRHWEALREHSIDGFYPGFPGFVEGEERARMAYGANYDRLCEVKARYDPENLLRNNLNVEPARPVVGDDRDEPATSD
ncbi:BBE domain-containing protein, partial [Halobium palmae]